MKQSELIRNCPFNWRLPTLTNQHGFFVCFLEHLIKAFLAPPLGRDLCVDGAQSIKLLSTQINSLKFHCA